MKSREYEYYITMALAKMLIKKGVITEQQYSDFNSVMLSEYAPITEDLFTDIHLR